MQTSESVANQLAELGIEVIFDDRDERAGVKFNDADLIGWPYQITVGKRGVKNGEVEVKTRATGEKVAVAIDEAAETVAKLVIAQRARFDFDSCER